MDQLMISGGAVSLVTYPESGNKSYYHIRYMLVHYVSVNEEFCGTSAGGTVLSWCAGGDDLTIKVPSEELFNIGGSK